MIDPAQTLSYPMGEGVIRDLCNSSLQLFTERSHALGAPVQGFEFEVQSLEFSEAQRAGDSLAQAHRAGSTVTHHFSALNGRDNCFGLLPRGFMSTSPVKSPRRGSYRFDGRIPRAPLRFALGYHIVVLSGLAEGQMREVTKRSHRFAQFEVSGLSSKVRGILRLCVFA